MIDWLFTNALAALALAAVAATLIWTFRPSPAVRHALWLVVVLKLVSPTGLVVSVPLPVEPPVKPDADLVATAMVEDDPVTVDVEVITVQVQPKPDQSPVEAAVVAMKEDMKDDMKPPEEPAMQPMTSMQTAVPPAIDPPGRPFDYRPYLLAVWVAGALVVGWRQLRETARFARFTARALPAGDLLMAEVAIVANRLGLRVPSVRVLAGLTSPVMWCLWRPVLLWPAGLECRLKGDGRRAVIAHELAHLRRRDHWVRRLEMVAAVLHWWNPLFWLARKKLRADAELACDAWATGQADRRAYAEALLEVCSFNPRRRPAPAVGVIGEGRRAMQERLTMIMKDRVPTRLAFGAKLVVALMVIAAVPAWTLGQSDDELAQISADDKQVDELEAQLKKLQAQIQELKASRQAEGQKTKAEAIKKLQGAQGQLGEKLKAVEELKTRDRAIGALYEKAKAAGQGQQVEIQKVIKSGEGGVKVIGPDGKEIQGAQVIITEKAGGGGVYTVKPGTGTGATKVPQVIELPGGQNKRVIVGSTGKTAAAQLANKLYTGAAGGSGQSVSLSRATYKLNREQAAALGTLLGSVKASVMETKVDGDTITVTTTPEVQATIGQVVRLVTGQGGQNFRFEYKAVPGAQGVPATPAVPALPAKPAKPARPAAPDKPGSFGVDADAIKRTIEVELKQLDHLKELKNLNIDVKTLEDLKDLKIDLKPLENLKNIEIDLSKLKDLEKLMDGDKVKVLKQRQEEVEKARAEIEKARAAQSADVEKLKAEAAKLRDKARADAEKLKARGQDEVEKRKAGTDKEKAEADRAAELKKAIEALIGEATKKAGSDKKPDGPAK